MMGVKVFLCLALMTLVITWVFRIAGVDLSGKPIPRSRLNKYFEEDIWEERKNGR